MNNTKTEDTWIDAEEKVISSPLTVEDLLKLYALREESQTYPVIWAIEKDI